jgi:hypothetical protein
MFNVNSAHTVTSVTLVNESNEELVAVSYGGSDIIQIVGFDRVHLHPFSEQLVTLKSPTNEPFRVHIYRIGMFGLISPRTRLSSGYGFFLEPGVQYTVRIIPPDHNGNLCAMRRVDRHDSSFAEIESPLCHRSGDRIVIPTLTHVGFVPDLPNADLGPHMFRIHHYNNPDRANKHVPLPNPVRMESQPVTIMEKEFWESFFEHAYRLGVWAHVTKEYITPGDLITEEPYLFVGLIALTLFDTIIRSMPVSGLVLVDGRRITTETCEENLHILFDFLTNIKKEMKIVLDLTENEKAWIEQFLLFAGCEKAILEQNVSQHRRTIFIHTFSDLLAVAAQLSDQSYFKANVVNVIDAISHTPHF